MVRNVQDLSMQSGQPNFPLTGGGYYNTSAFQAGPNIEGFDAQVIDNRALASTAVAIGTFYVEQFTALNSGDSFYAPGTTAVQLIPTFSYGVLTAVPLPAPAANGVITPNVSTGQNEVRLRQKGTCLALCITTATAIAVGGILVTTATGTLTAPASAPAAGGVVAIAKGTLAASTATPTLVLVSVGGY